MINSFLSLLRLDIDIFRQIHIGLHRDWLDQPMLLTTYTGDGLFQGFAMIAAIAWKKTRPYGLATAACWLLSGAIRLILVQIIQRQRPSNLDFAKPLEPIFGNTSFPSGHTTTSFAIAFMVGWMVYKTDKAGWGWFLFAYACLVGISRIYIGIHYPTDILGGMALAGICATLLYLLWEKKGWLPTSPKTDPSS